MKYNPFIKDTDCNTQYSLLDGASFMLARTNPKLTTNVKITTNGSNIWLDSFSADETLSDKKYKAYRVNPEGLYNKDVVKLYNGLDKSISYKPFQEFDDVSIKTTYDQQYETTYWMGCEYINSLEYDEELGYTAPIWLSDKLPNYFVIFKVEEPSYFPMVDINEGDAIRDLDFKSDILQKCTIVKTFDLSENSSIGKYIRNYKGQENFPTDTLVVSMKNGEPMEYKGISYTNGEFVSAYEYNYNRFYKMDETVIEFDKYITDGWERNGIILPNILNLQFLFNDETSKDYTLNRYFGLYCDTIDDGMFKVDFDRLKPYIPSIKFNVTKFVKNNVEVENDEGVLIPICNIVGMLPSSSISNDYDGIFYVRDYDGNLHKIDNVNGYGDNELRFSDKKLDIKKLTGFNKEYDFVTCTYENNKTGSQLIITINDTIPLGTAIKLCEDVNGNEVELGMLYSDTDYDGDTMLFTEGWNDNYMFCGKGHLNAIAKAFSNAFNATFSNGVQSFYFDNKVVLWAENASDSYNNFYIRIDDYSWWNYIELSNGGHFVGANSFEHIKVVEEERNMFKNGNYVVSNNGNGYMEIINSVLDLDNVKKYGNRIEFPEGIYYDILFDENGCYVSRNNQTAIYEEFVPSVGRLNFYPVKDFDFSTYAEKTIYGDMSELDYENTYINNILNSYRSELENMPELQNPFHVNVNGEDISITFNTDGVIIDSNNIHVRDIIGNGNVFTVPMFLRIINNEATFNEISVYLSNFNFETLSTNLNVNEKKYLNNEYERCYENYNPNLMFLSKSVPYVTKWVCKDNGLDVREKPYRLNTNMVFGQNSFSPNPYNMDSLTYDYNQEWLYLFEKYPTYDLDPRKCWSYIGDEITLNTNTTSIYDNELETNLKSTTENWFDIYFVRDNVVYDNKVYDTIAYKKKYSIFEKATANKNAETFFRGMKVEVANKVDYNETIDNNIDTLKVAYDKKLNGYKFSAVLVPIDIDIIIPIGGTRIKVIKNDVFKFVVLIVYVVKKVTNALELLKTNPNMSNALKMDDTFKFLNRRLLYQPNTGFVFNETNQNTTNIMGIGSITYDKIEMTNDYVIHGSETNFLADFSNSSGVESPYLLIMNNYNTVGTKHLFALKVNSVASDNELNATLMTQAEVNSAISNGVIFPPINLDDEYPSGKYIWNWVGNEIIYGNDLVYFIIGKDKSIIVDNIDFCSFGNIYACINNYQKDNIIYDNIDENGVFTTSNKDNAGKDDYAFTYFLKFVAPDKNAKYLYLSLKSDIDYVRYDIIPQNAIQVSRYGEYYMPLFKDVLYFKDSFIDNEFSDDDDYNYEKHEYFASSRFANTMFAYDYIDFGMLKNLAYHKANDINNNVYGFSGDEKPIYPISNIFSIGERDLYAFNSQFDPYYYNRVDSNIMETEIHGTSSMTEHKALMGSKYLKVPDELTFNEFTCGEYNEGTTSMNEVDTQVSGNRVFLYIHIEKMLFNHFVEKLTPLFEQYINNIYSYGDKTTIADDIEEYITKNIMPLYDFDSFTVMTKKTAIGKATTYDFTPIMDARYVSNDFQANHTVGVSTYSASNLDKKITINTVNGYDYKFGLIVKIVKK